MSSASGSLPISAIFQTIAVASSRRRRDSEEAVRQLATLDPKRFLAHLQAAATTRSSQAIKALLSDMHELEDIFQKLSRAGYDVSTAREDFQLLRQFVTQCMNPVAETRSHHTSLNAKTSKPRSRSQIDPIGSNAPTTTPWSSRSKSKMTSSLPPAPPRPSKHVHFASHATVYTLPPEPASPVFTPPSRPSCIPRSMHNDNRSHF